MAWVVWDKKFLPLRYFCSITLVKLYTCSVQTAFNSRHQNKNLTYATLASPELAEESEPTGSYIYQKPIMDGRPA